MSQMYSPTSEVLVTAIRHTWIWQFSKHRQISNFLENPPSRGWVIASRYI